TAGKCDNADPAGERRKRKKSVWNGTNGGPVCSTDWSKPASLPVGVASWPRRPWSAGKATPWNWADACITRPCAVDWPERKMSWWPETAHLGFGRLRKTDGPKPLRYWTFITPLNISGN